jgi:hypothetical protein
MASIPEPPETVVDRLASIAAHLTHSGKTGWDADAFPTTPSDIIPADQGDEASKP